MNSQTDPDITPSASLLLHCEDEAEKAYYIDPDSYREQSNGFFKQSLPVFTIPLEYPMNGEEVFVVSDLHIAAGRNKTGVYQGTENFLADDSFSRFLKYAHTIKGGDRAVLVINGDIFDFLRVTDYPGKKRKIRFMRWLKRLLKLDPVTRSADPDQQVVVRECQEWSDELRKIGINKSTAELEASVSSREKTYGLKTDDYKTVYKLMKIAQGHPEFFEALSVWLERGHRLVVLKGNHDLELYWLAVRNYLRLILAERMAARWSGRSLEDILTETVLPNIAFYDDGLEMENDVLIEHGHRYDKFTMVLEGPVLQNVPTQINIPFGSFFNRYLLNRIELYYPYLDNVRPTGNVLPMLMKSNFPLGLKVLTQYMFVLVWQLFRNMRYTWFMIHKVVWFLLALAGPVLCAWLLLKNNPTIEHITEWLDGLTGVGKLIRDQAKGLGALALSYLLSRIVAWFQLDEPSSLNQYAKLRLIGSKYRIMTMGHTHNPGEYAYEDKDENGKKVTKHFYNTGTWIPVVETSTADIREDKTYVFLHLERDNEGKLQPANNGLIQRWNDDAGRGEALVLMERK